MSINTTYYEKSRATVRYFVKHIRPEGWYNYKKWSTITSIFVILMKFLKIVFVSFACMDLFKEYWNMSRNYAKLYFILRLGKNSRNINLIGGFLSVNSSFQTDVWNETYDFFILVNEQCKKSYNFFAQCIFSPIHLQQYYEENCQK